MIRYANSSFLVSCYVTGAHTPQAKAYLHKTGAPLTFTALHALEVQNAFKLGVFRGLFPATAATAAWTNLEADLRSGRLVRKAVKWPVTLRIARRFSERYSSTFGTRSLDILHVAAAKAVRTVEFVSFDARQRTLATAVGLKIAP
jgi:hypothetical protein